VRTGPGKEFPIKFEINQKGYPLKIIAEFNNWRKVNTKNNLSGWIHTQLLSSFKTGLIIKGTVLKKRPLNSSKNIARLLPDLLIKVKECKLKWCDIEIFQDKKFVGWVTKNNIWDSVDK
jgi:SH3-like domain-containing protein